MHKIFRVREQLRIENIPKTGRNPIWLALDCGFGRPRDSWEEEEAWLHREGETERNVLNLRERAVVFI
jgi:hypothetical protein